MTQGPGGQSDNPAKPWAAPAGTTADPWTKRSLPAPPTGTLPAPPFSPVAPPHFAPPAPPSLPGRPAAGPARPVRSRRGLWIGLYAAALAITIVIGAAGGLLWGLASKPATDDSIPVAAAGQSNLVQITPEETKKLVESQSEALKAKDLKRFLAPYDPANKDLLASQTRMFNNLLKLPLSEARYEAIKQKGRAADSFGREVRFDLDVAFVHQFDGIDLRPVSEWYRWTVTKSGKDAPLVITKATGAPSVYDSSETVYYPAPWDKWSDIHIERTAHTMLLVEPSMAAHAKQHAPTLERAAVDDFAAWSAGGVTTGEVPKGFLVSLVSGKEQLGSLYRMTKREVKEAGVSIPMPSYKSLGGERLQAGATRVVIDVASEFFRPDVKSGPQLIFRHELAHSMVASLDTGKQWQLDSWVVEGFAEYMAHRGLPGPSLRLPSARAAIEAGAFKGKLPGNFDWGVGNLADFQYWLGHMAVAYLAKTYGEPAAFKFVAAHYQGAKTADAIATATGVSFGVFESGWATYVRAQAR